MGTNPQTGETSLTEEGQDKKLGIVEDRNLSRLARNSTAVTNSDQHRCTAPAILKQGFSPELIRNLTQLRDISL